MDSGLHLPDSGAAASASASASPEFSLDLWPGDVALLSRELRVVWLNESFATRLGVTQIAAQGRHWFELRPQSDGTRAQYRRALAGGEVDFVTAAVGGTAPYRSTLRFTRRNGQPSLLVFEQPLTPAAVAPAAVAPAAAPTPAVDTALAQSRERLSLTLEYAQVGLWELDVASGVARWFGRWCESEDLLPCDGPEHVDNWDQRIHPEDLQQAAENFAALLENRHDLYECEYRILTRSGQWRWILERSRAVERGPDGKPERVVGICINVHDRKQAERELRRTHLRLKSIAENSPDWLLLIDDRRRVAFCNREVFGATPEQLLGIDALTLSPVGFREQMVNFFADVLGGSEPQEIEQTLPSENGIPRIVLLRASPVRSEGQVVGAVVSATNISELRHQQAMLCLQARILETMREGVVLVDSHNLIRLTNPAFNHIFRAREPSLLGLSVEPLFRLSETNRESIVRRVRAQLVGAASDPVEIECQRLDGTLLTAACVITPMQIDGRDHWLAVLHDITDRKILEREILEVGNREQQRIGNDLHDGLGQELTGVALMLRGVATKIRREHPALEPEIDDIVKLVNRSISNTRTLARGLSPVGLERGGLVPALRVLVASAREAYSVSITLRTRLRQPLELDESSSSHLYRIVQEALHNAVRHGRASRITVQLVVDMDSVRLSVHDNGRGLPDPGMELTGLGLRAMRYRANMLGGHAIIENHREGGAIVRCICPHRSSDARSVDHSLLATHPILRRAAVRTD